MVTMVVVIGLITFNFTRRTVSIDGHGPVAAVAPLTTGYLVAAHSMPAGTLARDEDFVAKAIEVRGAPNDGFVDAPESRESLRGSLIRNFMDTGTLVTIADVLRPRDRGFIASVLREGQLAVSVGVDPISGVSGLVWPGDHVDILLTQEMGEKQGGHRVSETVLSDVRIIAIDQEMVQGASANNATAGKLAHTVTVEVDSPEAQKIAVATSMGKLSLAIRSATGANTVEQAEPTFGADVSPALAARAKPGRTVTVYEGTVAKEVIFQ
jgi:pilus assembly protein CpaB